MKGVKLADTTLAIFVFQTLATLSFHFKTTNSNVNSRQSLVKQATKDMERQN